MGALGRYGGILVRPRATAAALGPSEGRHDGLWLGLSYLLVGQLAALAEALASLIALRNTGGLLVLGSGLGRAVLPPLIAVVVAELLLGSSRAYRRGICLVPFVLVVALASVTGWLGLRMPWAYGPEILGGVLAWSLALWIRPAVVPDNAESVATPAAGGVLVGAVLAVLVAGVGVVEGYRVAGRWSSMGPLAPGTATPSFDTALVGGGRFARTDLEDQVNVLVFWATWCGVCNSEMPMFDELHHEQKDRGVQVVAVNREGVDRRQARARVSRYRESRGLGLPFAMDDGSMSRAFRVSMIPHTVVLDRQGEIRHVHQGRVRKSTLVAEIEDLLAE